MLQLAGRTGVTASLLEEKEALLSLVSSRGALVWYVDRLEFCKSFN